MQIAESVGVEFLLENQRQMFEIDILLQDGLDLGFWCVWNNERFCVGKIVFIK